MALSPPSPLSLRFAFTREPEMRLCTASATTVPCAISLISHHFFFSVIYATSHHQCFLGLFLRLATAGSRVARRQRRRHHHHTTTNRQTWTRVGRSAIQYKYSTVLALSFDPCNSVESEIFKKKRDKSRPKNQIWEKKSREKDLWNQNF